MKKSCYLFTLFAFSFTLFAFSLSAQQLKLGSHPTQIEKSAVLELESKNQGLLLTRVPDFDAIDAFSPPDGMIVYYTDGATDPPYGPNAGVYQRKDGKWLRISQFFKFVNDTLSQTTPVGFETSNDTVYLYIPDVHADKGIERGLINGGEQVFKGEKRFNDSLIAESILRANKMVLPLENTDSMVFLTTNKNGLVRLDTLDNVFWLLGGNSLMNPNRDSTLGTKNRKSLSIITNNETRILITSSGKVGIGTDQPNEVADTLTVNGSFKLGNGGSSFSAMARDSFEYQITRDDDYDVVNNIPILGIKKNAHVIINPRETLQNGSTIAIISWVRANAKDEITVCFKTTGSNNIPSSGTITFDVYYINPK